MAAADANTTPLAVCLAAVSIRREVGLTKTAAIAATVPTSGAQCKLQKPRRNRLDRARPQPAAQPKGLACSVTQS